MSNKSIRLLIKIISWGVMGASILIALVYFLRLTGIDPQDEIVATSYINWAIALFSIAVLLSVLFPLVHFLFNPENLVKVLLSLGAMAAVFVVSYLLSDGTPIVTAVSAADADFSNPSVLKFADTGIFATYILFGVALLLLLYTGARGLFNR